MKKLLIWAVGVPFLVGGMVMMSFGVTPLGPASSDLAGIAKVDAAR